MQTQLKPVPTMAAYEEIVLTFLCGLVIICFILQKLWYKFTSKYDSIYCPSNLPIVGSSVNMEKDATKSFLQQQQFFKEGKNVFITWLGWLPVIFSSKVEHAKAVLSGQTHLEKYFGYFVFHEWLNTGLALSHGDKWKQRRRMITPSFHFSILNEFIPVFEKHVNTFVETVMKAAKNDEVIEVQEPLRNMALHAISETSIGINSDKAGNKHEAYLTAMSTITEHMIIRMVSPWLWNSSIFALTDSGKKFYANLKHLHDYTIYAIQKRISLRNEIEKQEEQNKKVENKSIDERRRNICLIDTLLDSYQNGEIDADGIREEVDSFMFGGHETISTALSFCLYQIGIHTKYQKLIHQEIDITVGENITEMIRKMEMFDAVVKECLRLYPPVPLIGRKLEEDVEVDGVKIFKDHSLLINIYSLHRNEDYWERPTEFNPYRFLTDDYLQRHPYSYIPFSAGPRNCIGQKFALLEMKICLYKVLKNFEVASVHSENELKLAMGITLKSINGIHLKFKNRI